MLIDDIQGIGTCWWFRIYDGVETVEYYKNIINREIQKFEKAYSRFLPDSQISTLNRNRFLVDPSTELLELLEIGKKFSIATQGLFNPAIGHILENRGYDASYTFLNKGVHEKVASFDEFVNLSSGQISLTGEGGIDLGGYGKGYLIDKIANMFREELGIHNFLINGGGDIYGGGDLHHEVILEHPFALGYELGRIQLKNQGLGCSSNLKRSWKVEQRGKPNGHIVNPNNLNALSNTGSFAIAESALIADIMATVFCLCEDDIVALEYVKQLVKCEFISVFENMTMYKSQYFPTVLRS
jgi:FAD:protein FMN transferase